MCKQGLFYNAHTMYKGGIRGMLTQCMRKEYEEHSMELHTMHIQCNKGAQ